MAINFLENLDRIEDQQTLDWTGRSYKGLWASPDERLSVGELMDQNDWSRVLRPLQSRSADWYFECNLLGYDLLRDVVDINPRRRGGVPVIKGTRFTVSQLLAELSEGSSVEDVATNFGIEAGGLRDALHGLSQILLRPVAT